MAGFGLGISQHARRSARRNAVIRIQDPKGHIARRLELEWHGPESTLELTLRGTPQEIHDFREYMVRLAAGEAA